MNVYFLNGRTAGLVGGHLVPSLTGHHLRFQVSSSRVLDLTAFDILTVFLATEARRRFVDCWWGQNNLVGVVQFLGSHVGVVNIM